MAVAGYWNMPPFPLSCPGSPDYPNGAVPDCNPMYLADSDIHLGSYSDPTNPYSLKTWNEATGPALRPVIDAEAEGAIETIWQGVSFESPLRTQARRIVVVGHAGDPRAWACVYTPKSECMTNFVLDRVVWVEGQDAAISLVPPSYPRDRQPILSPEAAVAAATAEFGSGTLLTVLPIEAIWAPTIDPRVRAGVEGWVWIARAIVAPVDSAGTAPLEEVVLDDSTGSVVQRLSVSSSADYQPATLILNGGRGNGGTYDVALPDGTILLTGSTSAGANASAVLEMGDYRLLAWAGNAPPSNPPAGACVLDIHVRALEQVSYAASFGGPNYDKGPCTWDRVGPSPPTGGLSRDEAFAAAVAAFPSATGVVSASVGHVHDFIANVNIRDRWVWAVVVSGSFPSSCGPPPPSGATQLPCPEPATRMTVLVDYESGKFVLAFS